MYNQEREKNQLSCIKNEIILILTQGSTNIQIYILSIWQWEGYVIKTWHGKVIQSKNTRFALDGIYCVCVKYEWLAFNDLICSTLKLIWAKAIRKEKETSWFFVMFWNIFVILLWMINLFILDIGEEYLVFNSYLYTLWTLQILNIEFVVTSDIFSMIF